MKTVAFNELTDSVRRSVCDRVARMLESKARFNGQLCLESSRDVAARSEYRILRSGQVWHIYLPENLRFANQ